MDGEKKRYPIENLNTKNRYTVPWMWAICIVGDLLDWIPIGKNIPLKTYKEQFYVLIQQILYNSQKMNNEWILHLRSGSLIFKEVKDSLGRNWKP